MSRVKSVITGLILGSTILAGIISFSVISNQGPSKSKIAVVKRDSIRRIVSLSGQVKAKNSADLPFERGGRITGIFAKVGDRVRAGQILASTDASDLLAQLKQAEAQVRIQMAKLEELKRGARIEDRNIQNSKTAGAHDLLITAQRNLSERIDDAFVKSDDAVRNKADQLFTNPNSTSPILWVEVLDPQRKIDMEFERLKISEMFANWPSSIDDDGAAAVNDLNYVKNFIDNCAIVVNEMTPNATISSAVINGWKSDISLVRSNIALAISNLTAAQEKLKTAESNYSVSGSQQILVDAGATKEQLDAQEGQLAAAQASVDLAKVQITKSQIRAPFDGVVARYDVYIGQTVPSGVAFVTVVSENYFEIQTFIPESESQFVKVGEEAAITLDSVGLDWVYKAKVSSIDAVQTVIDGVGAYKAKIDIIGADAKIKTGMIANVAVVTLNHNNVLVVPSGAVFKDYNNDVVYVPGKNNQKFRKIVTVGIKNNDFTEILSGLNENDKVMVF
jgi:RND family efflux transporter MFP subunit